LAPDGSEVVFREPGSPAIAISARQRRVEINLRLVELVACESAGRAAPPAAPGTRSSADSELSEADTAAPASSPQDQSEPRLKSHEPPPGTSQSDDDCDCGDDLFDCDNKSKGGSGGSGGSSGSGGSGGSSTNCSDCTVRG